MATSWLLGVLPAQHTFLAPSAVLLFQGREPRLQPLRAVTESTRIRAQAGVCGRLCFGETGFGGVFRATPEARRVISVHKCERLLKALLGLKLTHHLETHRVKHGNTNSEGKRAMPVNSDVKPVMRREREA